MSHELIALSQDQRTLFDNPELLLTYDQLSKWIQLSRSTLEKYVHRSEIPFIRINARCVRFLVKDIKTWLLSKKEGVTFYGR